MSKRYLKVKDKESLVKDSQTNAIINTNRKEFMIARQAKNKRKRELLEKKQTEDKVSELEEKLNAVMGIIEKQKEIIDNLSKPKQTTRRKTTAQKSEVDSNG